jgi:hypothetical protein
MGRQGWLALAALLAAWACSEGGTQPRDSAGDAGVSSGGEGGEDGEGGASEPSDAGVVAGRGGSMGSAGSRSVGGSSGGSEVDPPDGSVVVETPCTIELGAELSPVIATVGIVEWTTDLAGIDAAHIDFGLDAEYGMIAPVDLAEPSYRTLLLGMKPSRTYHFRVVARAGQRVCTGEDQSITTGPQPNGVPQITLDTRDATALAGGYLLTGQYAGTQIGYILDSDGDFVWWYPIGSNVISVVMSYDGKFMWLSSDGLEGRTNVHRVSMDGLSDENLSDDFAGQNHQLAVLPDETVAFSAYSAGLCDDIKERAPDGTVRTLVNAYAAHQAGAHCHVNAVQYSPSDDTLIFSDLYSWNFTKIRRDGSVVWVLGGATSSVTGDGVSWVNQHGLHVLGVDRLLYFNNGAPNEGSLAIELLLDLEAMTATPVWTYAAEPPLPNQIMGDVQRLENGNTLVSYSQMGVVHEVSPTGVLLQEMSWELSGAFGYTMHRKSLYGPPPR